MKKYSFLILAAATFVGGCQTTPKNPNPAATSDITVNFKDSDKFTDVRESVSGPTSQYYLDELSKELKEDAARRLTAGQKLTVTFTDIDLAGDIPPGQLNDIRVIKSIYRPRMTLTFKLVDATGTVLKEGDRTLLDFSFMGNIPMGNQSDPLRYDKTLLSDWVNKEF